MTIGLSQNATRLLGELAQAHLRGAEQGLTEEQLWFRLSVRQQRTTIQFATDEPPVQTNDLNAIVVLRANGLIEPLTLADHDPVEARYIVTQAGLTTSERMTVAARPDLPEPKLD
ncbi:MAG TPA: hypothetical protein VFI42_20240 [Thermomicrobiaceae bacterium]|nr:hypothetical protein [Thermomicrobiaceae bacterium]